MLRLVSALVSFFLTFNCLADLRLQSPAQACTVLNDTELRAGEWTPHQDGHEGCTSGARLVTATSTDGNKISFIVEGLSGVPNRVRLILSVHLPSDEGAAKRELIKATKRLSVRMLGLSIPEKFNQSILKGESIQLDVGSGRASLIRTSVNKQSYVLSVLME